jgi:hypothetical protein
MDLVSLTFALLSLAALAAYTLGCTWALFATFPLSEALASASDKAFRGLPLRPSRGLVSAPPAFLVSGAPSEKRAESIDVLARQSSLAALAALCSTPIRAHVRKSVRPSARSLPAGLRTRKPSLPAGEDRVITLGSCALLLSPLSLSKRGAQTQKTSHGRGCNRENAALQLAT